MKLAFVQALRYKLEGRGSSPDLVNDFLQFNYYLQRHQVLGFTQPDRNEHQTQKNNVSGEYSADGGHG